MEGFHTVTGFFATVLAGEGFLHQSHGGFLRRCRLAGGFLHQFPRPDKATLKQQKLQLENLGFPVFPHILVCFLRDVSVTGASPPVMFLETISFPRPDKATFKQHKLHSTSRQGNFKTTKITAGKLRFSGISSYSRLFSS